MTKNVFFVVHENSDDRYNSEFLTELRGIVLENMTNDNFTVKDLAKEVRLSRSQLHRRLKAGSGISASCFIRETRLLRASELLLVDNKTISEIAYMVGFGSPSYFNKCFHDYFGYSPGEYKKQVKSSKIHDFSKTITIRRKNCERKYKPLFYVVFLVIVVSVVIILFFLFR